jgi:hypothetical protein
MTFSIHQCLISDYHIYVAFQCKTESDMHCQLCKSASNKTRLPTLKTQKTKNVSTKHQTISKFKEKVSNNSISKFFNIII